jgi:hypothetical protein
MSAVAPCTASGNSPNGLVRDTKPNCNRSCADISWLQQCPYFSDLFTYQLRREYPVASGLPSFPNLVSVVIGDGAKKQMGRIYAGRIVTLMADVHAFRDRPIDQFPRNTVSLNRATIFRESPIAIRVRTDPYPAGFWIRLFNLAPKPFGKRLSLGFPLTTIRTVLTGLVAMPHSKRRTAAQTTSNRRSNGRAMAANESSWLAFDPAVFSVRMTRYRGVLPTTAMAIAVRDRIVWGRLLAHRAVLSLGVAPGTFTALPGISSGQF